MTRQSAVQQDPSVVHSTFVLNRIYPHQPERVFSAFAFAAKKRRWYAAEGEKHDVELFEQDFRPGGFERVQYRFRQDHPLTGKVLVNDGVFQDIIENRRIVLATAMTIGDQRVSGALITFEFLPQKGETELICTHQGAFFEGSGGPEMREAGWKVLLDRLGKALDSE